ncbi:interleukin 19 like [Chanos chanos]|uniref:Interleukin family protein n=1 Tax=Chanos chanos TaxID=29144 RepID=A0A6J2VSK0_CHACN|nr:interleukin-20-like [Chanos chanos]
MMWASGIVSSLLVCTLLCCLWDTASGWKLYLGTCTVSVHTHELRHHFHEIRQSVLARDRQLGVKLLRRDMMKNVQDTERCCFLRHLLRFYVERVFSCYAATQSQHRRTINVLANAFLSIKRDLRVCHEQNHCPCGEETRMEFSAIQAKFEKLEQKAAAVKAVAELDSLLEWLDAIHHRKEQILEEDDKSHPENP